MKVFLPGKSKRIQLWTSNQLNCSKGGDYPAVYRAARNGKTSDHAFYQNLRQLFGVSVDRLSNGTSDLNVRFVGQC